MFFLPANTTSQLQPLDLGIIKNFKVHYRRFLLKYVLSKIDECDTTSDVIKSVNILIAIRWVAQAWRMVKSETISKCFRKAGVLDTSMEVVTCGLEEDDEDPFLTSDDAYSELQALIDKTMTAQEKCAVDEYVNGDDDLAVCVDLDSDCWEENFLAQIGQDGQETPQVPDDDEDEDEDVQEMDGELPPLLKLHSYKEAIQSLEDVQQFLYSRGHTKEAMCIGSSIDTVASLKTISSKQTTLHNYFC